MWIPKAGRETKKYKQRDEMSRVREKFQRHEPAVSIRLRPKQGLGNVFEASSASRSYPWALASHLQCREEHTLVTGSKFRGVSFTRSLQSDFHSCFRRIT